MFNKKRLLFIVMLLTLTLLVVACGEDDEKLINQSLDTLAEGIEEGNLEKIESVLAAEIYDAYFDETIGRKELAEEMAMIKDEVTFFAPEGVEFVVEFRNRKLKDFSEDKVLVEADGYFGTIMPLEAVIKQLEDYKNFYDPEKIEQAIEALEDEDIDSAKEYLMSAGLHASEAESFATGEHADIERVEVGLIKEDGQWYINLINE